MKEHIGYTGKNASCFNFNADRYCCSNQNAQLYNNLFAREAVARSTLPRNTGTWNPPTYGGLGVGLVQPQSYNMPSVNQNAWLVPCSKMPCGIYANRFPCKPTSQIPYF